MSALPALKHRPSTLDEKERKPETARQINTQLFPVLLRHGLSGEMMQHPMLSSVMVHDNVSPTCESIRISSQQRFVNASFTDDWWLLGDASTFSAYWADASGLVRGRAKWKGRIKDRIDENWSVWPDVSEATARSAKAFVDALPDNVDEPDVVPTPQGEIDFSWDNDSMTFGVLVLPSGDLGMAGMFDEMKLYGNTRWRDKGTLPGFVASGLEWVHSRDL